MNNLESNINFKEIPVILLAAGIGERLRPLTNNLPKPMVPILNKPFLEYKIMELKKQGFENIILCVGYLGNKIEEYFKDGKDFGVKIQYAYGDVLGTGGNLKTAEYLVKSDYFVVQNGDQYLNLDLKSLIKNHLKKRPLMTISLTPVRGNPEEKELAEFKGDALVNFYKRATLEHAEFLKNNSSPFMNSGNYVFEKKIFDFIPPKIKFSLEQELFPKILSESKVFLYEGYFRDLANISLCQELEQDFTSGVIKNPLKN